MHRPPDTTSFNHHIIFFKLITQGWCFINTDLIPDIFLSLLGKRIQVKHQNID